MRSGRIFILLLSMYLCLADLVLIAQNKEGIPIMPRNVLESEVYFNDSADYHLVYFFLNETLTHEIGEDKARYRLDDFRKGNRRVLFVTHIKNRVMVRRYAFENGMPVGNWPCFNKRGILRYEMDFDPLPYVQRDGFVPEIDYPLVSNKEDGYQIPQFPFDSAQVEKRLMNPSVLPREYRLNELIGTGSFVIQMHVDRNGLLSHAYILEGVNPTIDYMIWQNIKKYEVMRPGRYKGEPVNCAFNLVLHADFIETPIQKEVRDWKRR